MEKNASKFQDSDSTILELQSDKDVLLERASNTKPANEMVETQEKQKPADHIVLEYHEQNPYDLSYTCLLIPRFTTHYLIGDIVDDLPVRMKQICISFGWNLEFLSLKAEHMQWTLRVPPAVAPGYFMKLIREHTSKHIFENYVRFKKENSSNDFWAPGYLVILGSQPHPVEMIRRFTRLTRQQQGFSPND